MGETPPAPEPVSYAAKRGINHVGQKPEGVKVSTNCNHEVWVKDGKVYMANDDDGWYVQEFSSASQIDAFIKILKSARDECFRPTMRAVDPPSALVGGDNSENSAGN